MDVACKLGVLDKSLTVIAHCQAANGVDVVSKSDDEGFRELFQIINFRARSPT